MSPEPLELGLLALSCVVAAVGGVHLATWQNAADVQHRRHRWRLPLRSFGARGWWYKPRVARSANARR
jgi:hypothetical protein